MFKGGLPEALGRIARNALVNTLNAFADEIRDDELEKRCKELTILRSGIIGALGLPTEVTVPDDRVLIAAVNSLREEEESSELVRGRLAFLLEAICKIVKGPNPHNMLNSWHDLPECVEGQLNFRDVRIETLRAEVDVLRGVGCEEDGDGPCGVCVKCLRRKLEECAAIARKHAARIGADSAGAVSGEIEFLLAGDAKTPLIDVEQIQPPPVCSHCGHGQIWHRAAWSGVCRFNTHVVIVGLDSHILDARQVCNCTAFMEATA